MTITESTAALALLITGFAACGFDTKGVAVDAIDAAGPDAALITGTTYYVRLDGNDANAGTTNTPAGAWRTIQTAADIMVAGDSVRVQPGIYNEEVVPANGGTAGNPITYFADGAVVLDGMATLNRAFFVDGIDDIVIDGFEITNYPDVGEGTVVFCDSDRATVRNCVIHDTGRDALYFAFSPGGVEACSRGDEILVENNLIYNILDDGFTVVFGTGHVFRNNTFYGCIDVAFETTVLATDILMENNIISCTVLQTGATYNYNHYASGALQGTANITGDPLLVDPAAGDFHLSHTAAGQAADSPCIDAGSDTAANIGLSSRGTRTDGVSDSGTVDIGFHY